VAIRPEWIQVAENQPALNGIRARVTETIYRGTNVDLWLDPGPLRIRTNRHRGLKPGDQVWLELLPERLVPLEETEDA
jgi:spermidine/putrescine transport system ATP-binding protein